MLLFRVLTAANGFVLDVEQGDSFGQYVFTKDTQLIKAIKELLDAVKEENK